MRRSRRMIAWFGLLVGGGCFLLLSFAGCGGKDNAVPSPIEFVGYIAGVVLSFAALALLLLEVICQVVGWFLHNRKQS